MAVTIDKLKGFDIFRSLTDSELEVIAEYAKEEIYSANNRIFEEKSLATKIYLVVEGKVSIRMGVDLSGKQLEVDTISPGETFGWSAITEPHTFTAAAWTLMETKAIAIPGDMLRDIFKKNNHIGYLIMKEIALVISRRLKSAREKFVVLLPKP